MIWSKFQTYISTLSTFTPQGSVASSNVCSITWLMVSLSDNISAKCFVPRTFLNVVAANKWVEWLKNVIELLPKRKKLFYSKIAGLSNHQYDFTKHQKYFDLSQGFITSCLNILYLFILLRFSQICALCNLGQVFWSCNLIQKKD